jgi:DNA polymerase-3 subunit alpha
VIAAIERSHHGAHNVVGDVQPDRTMKLPTSIVVPAGMTADTRLFELCREGMDERSFTGNSVYEERLTKELDVIRDKKFAEYFLTLREIIHVAQSAMLVGPGRGSGAGSLVTYLLKITDVDPIKYDLLFERFLNKYREEAPDVDTDVSNRAKLIELLKERFGAENVVPISNYNTFKLKTLIKDVAKFYGVPFEEANNATKTVEAEVRKATLKHGDDKNLFVLKFEYAMQHSPSFKSFIDAHPQVAGPIATLFKQQRSLGRHAGGVIVCDRIAERMPLIASKGELQTPWAEGVNVKELDQFGWIKFDLLGLDTLRIVEKTIELIITSERKARGWYEIDTDIGSFYAHGDAVAITNNRGNVFVRDLVEGDDVSDLML